jgi:hypothetical protein
MLGFDPITANATLDLMTITDGISGYSIERGCDHWVRFEKKVDNTTAIVSLKAEEISRTKVLNASQAIQGKAAGVQVVSSDLPGVLLSYY